MAREMARTDSEVFRALVRVTFERDGREFTDIDVYGPYSALSTARSVGAAKANEKTRWFGAEATYSVEVAYFDWKPVA